VETGAYRLQAASVVMNANLSVGAGGVVNGPISFGSHSSATVNNVAGPSA
jgi:hypothetical protein